MTKKDALNKAQDKVVTYGQVMSCLNNIAKNSGNSEAYFSTDLISPEKKKVTGFKFSSAQQEADLSNLLKSLKISFIHYYPTINNQVGELHIMPEHAEVAKKLFNNWSSWVIVERNITGNKELDAKWSEVVSCTR